MGQRDDGHWKEGGGGGAWGGGGRGATGLQGPRAVRHVWVRVELNGLNTSVLIYAIPCTHRSTAC
jgi:hypothetical protein